MPLDRELSRLAVDSKLVAIEQSLTQRAQLLSQETRAIAHDSAVARLEQLRSAAHFSVFNLMERFGYLDWHDESLHSRMLEFLLNPRETHGLGGRFLKELMRKVSGNFLRGEVSCSDPDTSGDLSRAEVLREDPTEGRRRVDLRIRDQYLGFALVIENKIRERESRDQLKDYWTDEKRKNPDFAIAGLLISPDGRKPESAGRFPVVPLSYGELTSILEEGIGEQVVTGSSDARIAVQYVQALKRWFMEDPELKSLAWRLHSLYPRALEYLRAPEATRLGQIDEKLVELIKAAPELALHEARKLTADDLEQYFVLAQWEGVPRLRSGAASREAHYEDRLLVFWFGIYSKDDQPSFRDLVLYLSCARAKKPQDRGALFSAIRKSGATAPPKNLVHDTVQSNAWTELWAKPFAPANDLKNPDRELLFKSIERRWKEFLKTDLPKIRDAVGALNLSN